MKYVSDLKELENKKFETEAELKKAEAEVEKKKAAEVAKTTERKEDASQVEQAFKARNASREAYNLTEVNARKKYNDTIVEARRAYNKAIIDAKVEYNNALRDAAKALDVAEDAYGKAIREFQAKHPEGYHFTLRDDDNVTAISHSGNGLIDDSDEFKKFNALVDQMLNKFFW